MMGILHYAEETLDIIVQLGILILEFTGVCVLLISAVKSVIGWMKKAPQVPLQLARGIAFALEYKLGSEVLRTVIVREWSELLILGAVILLRGALAFLVHWEIKNEGIHAAVKETAEWKES